MRVCWIRSLMAEDSGSVLVCETGGRGGTRSCPEVSALRGPQARVSLWGSLERKRLPGSVLVGSAGYQSSPCARASPLKASLFHGQGDFMSKGVWRH